MKRRWAARQEGGETLIEIVVTVFILGVAAVSIAAGMTVNIKLSDIHRKEANAGSYVRDFAESVVANAAASYHPCITLANARLAPPTGYASYSTPSSVYVPSITAIAYWNPALATPAFQASCPGGVDTGLQQLTLQVATNDLRATEKLVVVIRSSCGPGSSCS